MAAIHIHGYSDHISVRPGERIQFMVSLAGASTHQAEIVRLINGDQNPQGPGPKEEVVATSVSGEISRVRSADLLRLAYRRG
jgi:N,N-dimethylformamidase